MRYALNLASNNRILSAWDIFPSGSYDGMPVVEELPEGDIYEYRYENGEYIHDPLPESERPETPPTAEEILNAMMGVNRYA
jgi:hypothetical protein